MFAGVDMDRMGAEWRLHLDYDTLSLGGTPLLSRPLPLALCVGSFVVYWLLFAASFVSPLPSPSSLETMKRVHNLALAAYSGLCCGYTVWWLLAYEHTTFDRFMCSRMDGSGAELVFASFTLSKLWEWGDTVLLVWGGRSQGRGWQWTNKTVLHCFHHSTTFWLFLLVSNFPVAVKTGTLLNGAVHTIMYYYYADPSAFPKQLVPLITQGQIAQLVTVTVLWIITPSVCREYSTFPATHFPEYVTPQVMVPLYILMFITFYFKRFKPEGEKKGKRE